MASQEQKNTSSRTEEEQLEDSPLPTPAPDSGAAQAATSGVDDLLDEIDGVLETNAEEFVRGFVQKGGQ
ncbi:MULTISPECIES: ubiquitin-like protein Pup [unclassified Arthrobacter]|uniref:ubiquitin-like protein Pup n=1 Tax=unclassified Arthrobacter TaxID=235627 RepID=UPI00159E29BC|nr:MULTISPECIES: ubiquitin-like protein Pup [unclassified Arthrobacter]MCQ9165790.1 ubiquitin-like protein Pup [Arthrobacter sp. STN4]NVM98025.1 ubiquitin-like protein Pup [Arthrobacter sp. SDTb3-6]